MTLDARLQALYDNVSEQPAKTKAAALAELQEYSRQVVEQGIEKAGELHDTAIELISEVNDWALGELQGFILDVKTDIDRAAQVINALATWQEIAGSEYDFTELRRVNSKLLADYNVLKGQEGTLLELREIEREFKSPPIFDDGPEKTILYLKNSQKALEQCKPLEETKLIYGTLDLKFAFDDDIELAGANIRKHFGQLSGKITKAYKAKDNPDLNTYHALKKELGLYSSNGFLDEYINGYEKKIDEKAAQLEELEQALKAKGYDTTPFDQMDPIYVLTDLGKDFYFVVANSSQQSIIEPIIEQVVNATDGDIDLEDGAEPIENGKILFRLESMDERLNKKLYIAVLSALEKPGIPVRGLSDKKVGDLYYYPEKYDFKANLSKI